MLFLSFCQTAWTQTTCELLFTVDEGAYYKFTYPSTSVTGEEVTLSSLMAFWKPDLSQPGDTINTVHIHCHYTVSANSQCATSIQPVGSFDFPDFLFFKKLIDPNDLDTNQDITRSILILPDYEGYGASVDRTHPYLAQQATAQQVVDAVTYGLQVYQELVEASQALPMSSNWRSYCSGYSQGGAVALAVQRHIEEHDLGNELHFHGTICGDGPYDLISTLRYYLEDDGNSYGVSTEHQAGQTTLPYVIPMILDGMMACDSIVATHSMSDYLSASFISTGILEWLKSKTIDTISKVWVQQLNDGYVVVNGITYNAPDDMESMFTVVPGLLAPTVYANLNKILSEGFYTYLTTADLNTVPTETGDAYKDMHRALAYNNVCRDWEPKHRIQFMHSKGDMVVPYGNYLAFRETHPDSEGLTYRINDTFSQADHQMAAVYFLGSLASSDYAEYFNWLDGTNYSIENHEIEGNGSTFAFFSNGQIIIADVDDNFTLQISDMTGRIVYNGAECHISTMGTPPGVYVLRLLNGNSVKTQKIVIN